MTIETERLLLYPISNEQITALIEDETNVEIKAAYTEMFQNGIKYPEERIWYVPWFIALKKEPQVIVGDFCFKGFGPMVEIGYGLRSGFCKKGYMTEAVRAVCEWALAQDGVSTVEAETDSDNTSSQRVLLKAGFVPNGKYGEEGPRYTFSVPGLS